MFIVIVPFWSSLCMVTLLEIPDLQDLIPFCPLFVLRFLGGLCIVLWLPLFLIGFLSLFPHPSEGSSGRYRSSGIYHFVRKPIQSGLLVTSFGIGLILNNIGITLTCLLGWVAAFIYGKVEEKHLTQRLGKDYQQYKDRTPLLIPNFHLLFRRVWNRQ